MIVATFGPTTAWAGKTITYEGEQFALEGYGPIAAADAVAYDRQGHLLWAYDGLREWAYGLAGQPVPAASPPAAAAADAAQPAAEPPVVAAAAVVTPVEAAPEAAPAEPPAVVPPVVPPSEATAIVPPVAVTPQPAATAPEATAVAPPEATPPQPAYVPSAEQPPAFVPPTATAAATSPGGPVRWVFPVVAVVFLIILVVVALALAGGRLRDGLGITFTVLAVVFALILVWGALKPDAAARLIPGLKAGALLIVSGVLCAACLGLGAFLWWMPHYEVLVPADDRIVLDDKPEMVVRVVNHGLLPGTYKVPYGANGAKQADVELHLGPGETQALALSLSTEADPGEVVLSLGGTEIAARAMRPPEYHVAPLVVEPKVAKVGQTISVETSVENSGDIAGTFPGALEADGDEVGTQPVEVGPGVSEPLAYTFSESKAGDYRLSVGDAEKLVVVVKPVRLSNGRIVTKKLSGGRATLTIKNSNSLDAMVVLTRMNAPSRAALSVYVRKNSTAIVKGIPDGKYTMWNCIGSEWNWYTRDFLEAQEYKRWRDPLKFSTTASTKYWTTSWSDSRYIYTQKHSQTTNRWANWKVTLGSGPSKYSKEVSATGFPKQ